MNGKRWAALGIAAVIFCISVVSSVFQAFSNIGSTSGAIETLFSDTPVEKVIETGDGTRQIAILEVNGTIQDTGEATSFFTTEGYHHRSFMKQLNYIKENPNVKGMILQINSPGGGVVESAEIYDKIKEIMDEKEIPIYVSMGAMAASGGYYIAAPATKIFASKETITGSIGVIMQSINYAGLAEKLGIETITIKSGPYKDIMSSAREMTDEEKTILQEMLNNSYEDFIKIIADGRKMSESDVRKLADGRIYDGRQAKKVGLIDEFGYLEDVIQAMKEDFNLRSAQVVRYEDELSGLNSLFGFISNKLQGSQTQSDSKLIAELLSKHNSPRLMYLYSE